MLVLTLPPCDILHVAQTGNEILKQTCSQMFSLTKTLTAALIARTWETMRRDCAILNSPSKSEDSTTVAVEATRLHVAAVRLASDTRHQRHLNVAR